MTCARLAFWRRNGAGGKTAAIPPTFIDCCDKQAGSPSQGEGLPVWCTEDGVAMDRPEGITWWKINTEETNVRREQSSHESWDFNDFLWPPALRDGSANDRCLGIGDRTTLLLEVDDRVHKGGRNYRGRDDFYPAQCMNMCFLHSLKQRQAFLAYIHNKFSVAIDLSIFCDITRFHTARYRSLLKAFCHWI